MNVKPGDLAYLSSDCVDEGVIVEVLSAGPIFDAQPSWHCLSRTPIRCDGNSLLTKFCVQDRYLRPISGVPVNDEVKDEVTA